eukprot:scaffold295192_cov17-Tisochrysis_lutea.AAC.1
MSVEMRGELPWNRHSQDLQPSQGGGGASHTDKGSRPRRGSVLLPGELPWDLRGQQALGGPDPPPPKPRGGSRARRMSVEMRGVLPWNRNSQDLQHRRSAEQGSVGGRGVGLSGDLPRSMELPTAPTMSGAHHGDAHFGAGATAAAAAGGNRTGEGRDDGCVYVGVPPAGGGHAGGDTALGSVAAAGGKGGGGSPQKGSDLLSPPQQGMDVARDPHDPANAAGEPATATGAAAGELVAGGSEGGEAPWAASAGCVVLLIPEFKSKRPLLFQTPGCLTEQAT